MDYARSTDRHFMTQALEAARNALADGEFPVGCVLVWQNRVVAGGRRTHTRGECPNEIDHAEITALRRLYTIGTRIDRSAVTLYCTLEPCLMCFGAILLSGIRKIVYAFEDPMGGGTGCDLEQLTPLYRRPPVTLVSGVLRAESLQLLKAFFARPQNTYWGGSLLAEYIRKQ